MSFFGDVFDGIGNAIGDIFGGSKDSGIGDIIGAVGGALSSAFGGQQPEAPSAPGMGQFGPHQNPTENPMNAGGSKAMMSEDPRVLEAQWLERMRRFRTLGLITTPPKYSYGEQ